MNYLLDFNGCFYGVFFVGHFDGVCFTFFEFVDNFFVQCLLCNTFRIGFHLVGFAIELECYLFSFNQFAVDFKGCF